MSRRSEVCKETIVFTFATQLTQLLAVAAGILTRNVLGPAQMGMWATLQIILHYASYATLGTTQGIARETPYYVGKGRREKAEKLRDIVVSYQLISSLVTGLGISIVALLLVHRLPAPLFWGLLVTGLLAVLQRVNALLISILRAYKEFYLASSQMVLSAIVNLVLIAALTYWFHLYGFFAAMILSFVFNIAYILFYYPCRCNFVLGKELGGLIAFGFPLMLLSVLEATFRSIDKIFIVHMLGFAQLGLYSVALMACTFIGQLPNAFGIIMIPHFQERYGERDSVDDVRGYVDRAATVLSEFMPLVVGASWLILPLFVQFFLPRYEEGTRAAQILILSAFFLALVNPYGIVLVTLKRHLRLFPIVASTLAFAAAADWIAIQLGFGINGVALATTLCSFLNFVLTYVVASQFLYSMNHERLTRLIGPITRFAMMVALMLLLERFIIFGDRLLTVALRLVLFVMAYLPSIQALNREYGLWVLIREHLLPKRVDAHG